MVYFALSALLLCYLANGYVLLAWALLTRRREARRAEELRAQGVTMLNIGEWPLVLTQLPLYNEPAVAARVIDAAAALDYPAGRHHIQVLDDSSDETGDIVDVRAEYWRSRGVAIEVVRRKARAGFKAGALHYGLAQQSSALVAVFDADFVPPPDFLRKMVPVLVADAGLGWVQARWEHLNAGANLLTRGQAVGIDAHFAVEQAARSAGLFMAFNGSAGVWRRGAIEEAGGWSAATLTEDLDLSCRAALCGWRGLLLPDVAVPAEVPASPTAYQAQQFRWAKGTLQTARTMLPRIWQGAWPWYAKAQATLHLTQYLLHPLLLLIALMTPWMAWAAPMNGAGGWAGSWQLLLGIGLVGGSYLAGQRLLRRPWSVSLAGLGALLLVGTSTALGSTRAAWEALIGRRSDFLRTPKRGTAGMGVVRMKRVIPAWLELGFAAYALGAMVVCVTHGWFAAVPMLFFCATGSLAMVLPGREGDGVEEASKADSAVLDARPGNGRPENRKQHEHVAV